MNAYQEIDGIPVGISYEILTELLRNKLNFKRVVVSDYGTIQICHLLHRIAPNVHEAAILAFNAGLEVELPTKVGYGKKFVKAVKSGRVSEEKLNLTLFETPYVDEDPQKIKRIYNDPRNKEVARKIALKSMVLLKNENNLLPIDKDIKSIAVIGPNADSVRNLLGDYTYVGQFESTANNATGVEKVDKGEKEALMELIKSLVFWKVLKQRFLNLLKCIMLKAVKSSEMIKVDLMKLSILPRMQI